MSMPVIALTPRFTMSPFSEYSVGTSYCVSAANGMRFRHFDDVRPRERAEAVEAVAARGRVGAHVAAAQPAAVGQRVLDPADAPAFLIEHQVVHDAANGELGVLFDRIILQVLVAAVAVDEVRPVRVALADAAAQPKAHRRTLDVERLVVLEDAHRFADVEIVGPRLDLLEEQRQADRGQKVVAPDRGRGRCRHSARTPSAAPAPVPDAA